MPVLNEAKNIDQLISIIRAQTHRNYLLVIQDNSSEDDTLAIARQHESQDNRIQVFSNAVQVIGGENWWSITSKVEDLDKYDYCCFQAGDDNWGDQDYLSNLVKMLDSNLKIGAVNPTFEIVSSMNEVIKTIEVGLDSNYAFLRVWKLCRDWDNVHHIYGLYRREVFEYLLKTKVSKFTHYSGSDWWWTYEFLSTHRSIASKDSIYRKLLDPPEENSVIPIKRGRLLSYLQSVRDVCKPETMHLARARLIRHNYHLGAIPLIYFMARALNKLGKMHCKMYYGIIRRRFLVARRLRFLK